MAGKKQKECIPQQPKYPREPYPSTAKPGSVLDFPSFPMPDADGCGDGDATFMFKSNTNGKRGE
jgi:hypothetical protein